MSQGAPEVADDQHQSVRDIIDEWIYSGGEVEEEEEDIDFQVQLDLAERLDTSYQDRLEAIIVLESVFNTASSNVILKAVQLLEGLVKNCKDSFHRAVASKGFQQAVFKLLDRKRGKKSFFKSVKQNIKNWETIEKKVLYLIQLWYDTFMMHEAEFPFIMENYKTLRKEGIKFPDRDPSEIHMINFSGQKSPIFNVLEEQRIQQSGTPKNKIAETWIPQVSESVAAKFELSSSNIQLIAENAMILQAIIEGATLPEDMQTSYAQEIIESLMTFIGKVDILVKIKQDEGFKGNKTDIMSIYNNVLQTIQNYNTKITDIVSINKAMEESAIEEFSKTAEKIKYQKSLKGLSIPPPQSKPSGSSITTTSSQIKQQQDINTLTKQKSQPNPQPATTNNNNINVAPSPASPNKITNAPVDLLDLIDSDPQTISNPIQPIKAVQSIPQQSYQPQLQQQLQNNPAINLIVQQQQKPYYQQPMPVQVQQLSVPQQQPQNQLIEEDLFADFQTPGIVPKPQEEKKSDFDDFISSILEDKKN